MHGTQGPADRHTLRFPRSYRQGFCREDAEPELFPGGFQLHEVWAVGRTADQVSQGNEKGGVRHHCHDDRRLPCFTDTRKILTTLRCFRLSSRLLLNLPVRKEILVSAPGALPC